MTKMLRIGVALSLHLDHSINCNTFHSTIVSHKVQNLILRAGKIKQFSQKVIRSAYKRIAEHMLESGVLTCTGKFDLIFSLFSA